MPSKGETVLADLPGIIIRGRTRPGPCPLDGRRQAADAAGGRPARFYLERGGILNLQTKRGCPFRCIYCTYPHIEGSRMRLVPPDEVAREARGLQEMGARYLFITDSAFNADYDHSLAVARAFRRQGLTIPWGAFFAPTRPPDGYYEVLAEAGLTHAEFGTESLCDPQLKRYGETVRCGRCRCRPRERPPRGGAHRPLSPAWEGREKMPGPWTKP